MALSNDQIYLLNMLYAGQLKGRTDGGGIQVLAGSQEGRTVGDIANELLAMQAEVGPGALDGSTAQHVSVLEAITKDPELCSMVVVDMYSDSGLSKTGEGGAHSFTVITGEGTSPREAVTVFEGSATRDDWRDNFLGGTETKGSDGVSTELQEAHLKHYQEVKARLAEKGVEYTTVTGHSKGGNKAQYVTIMDGSVDRCVSFDGQGFSDPFVEKYRNEIAQRQNKILNFAADNDYVNILLNQIGEKRYIQGNQNDLFFSNHSMYTLWKDGDTIFDGKYDAADRISLVRNLDQFVNGYLRTASPDEKAAMMDVLGNLLAETHPRDGQNSLLSIVGKLLVEGDIKEVMHFLGAFIGYASQQSPEERAAWLAELGLDRTALLLLRKLMDGIDSMSPIEIARLLAGIFALAPAVGAVAGVVLMGILLANLRYFMEGFRQGVQIGANKGVGDDRVIRSESSPYDRVKVDFAAMSQLVSQLNKAAGALRDASGEIRGCAADCEDQEIGIRLDIPLPLISNIIRMILKIAGSLQGTPAAVLRKLADETRNTADAMGDYAKRIQQVCDDFEAMEQRNASLASACGTSLPTEPM